jgi:hypothetical protein
MIIKKRLNITSNVQQREAQLVNRMLEFCPFFLMSYLIGKLFIFENGNQ